VKEFSRLKSGLGPKIMGSEDSFIPLQDLVNKFIQKNTPRGVFCLDYFKGIAIFGKN
jgi:hypothetical protein